VYICVLYSILILFCFIFLYFGTTRHSLCFHWAIHLLAAKLSVTLLLLFLFLFLLLNYSHLLFVCTTGNTCRNSVKSAYFCVDYAASKSRHTRKITLIDIRTFLRCHQRLAMQFFRKSHSVRLGQTTHGFHSSGTLDRICVSERISHDARNDLSLRRWVLLVEEID